MNVSQNNREVIKQGILVACGKIFRVLGRLFMRRTRGVGTGGPDHPSFMEKHKAVYFLKNVVLNPLVNHKPI